MARRDYLESRSFPWADWRTLFKMMHDIQNIYDKPGFQNSNTFEINSYDEFRERIEKRFLPVPLGRNAPETEARDKRGKRKPTIRLIRGNGKIPVPGNCM